METFNDIRVFGETMVSLGYRSDGTGFLGERKRPWIDGERVWVRPVTAARIISMLDAPSKTTVSQPPASSSPPPDRDSPPPVAAGAQSATLPKSISPPIIDGRCSPPPIAAASVSPPPVQRVPK